jgi:ABC-type bacteriocin/lantibiotic exporter with double-glycine peptidase domain
MLETFNKIRDILPRRQRHEAVALFAVMTLAGLIEAASVASIIPFMAVIANPGILHQAGVLGRMYAWTGSTDDAQFLFLLGLVLFVVLIVGNAVKALTTWLIQQYTFFTGHVLARSLVGAYLAQPYSYFLSRHTAELGKNVLAEVQQVVVGVIQPGLTLLARCVVAVLMLSLIVVADPMLALGAIAVLGGGYGILYVASRRYLSRIARERVEANRARYHVTVEAFAAIKEIKLRGLEQAYLARFAEPSRKLAQSIAASQALSQLPRYGLESIAFGGVLATILYLLHTRGGLVGALPMISLFAFAGYRMLPTLQEIFSSLASMRFAKPALSLLHRDLTDKRGAPTVRAPLKPLPFGKELQLDRVSFRYPTGDRDVLHNVSLTISRGDRIGFVGPTGSGKSTIIDLILGLLSPTSGQVLVDGQLLKAQHNISRWQSQIGYVPQQIFLADDTIAANIAFGALENRVDSTLVERAARMAQLHDFIVNELPAGYATPVGERGVRLSGGQRQRLGLARSLYGNPAVLVLDEATSALDSATEDEVITALDGIGRECTIIMIAHRVSTLRHCDILVKIESGRIAAVGSYADVVGAKTVANA